MTSSSGTVGIEAGAWLAQSFLSGREKYRVKKSSKLRWVFLGEYERHPSATSLQRSTKETTPGAVQAAGSLFDDTDGNVKVGGRISQLTTLHSEKCNYHHGGRLRKSPSRQPLGQTIQSF